MFSLRFLFCPAPVFRQLYFTFFGKISLGSSLRAFSYGNGLNHVHHSRKRTPERPLFMNKLQTFRIQVTRENCQLPWMELEWLMWPHFTTIWLDPGQPRQAFWNFFFLCMAWCCTTVIQVLSGLNWSLKTRKIITDVSLKILKSINTFFWIRIIF